MPRRRPLSVDAVQARRRKLQEDIEKGGLPVATAIRRMREALDMTQERFAQVFGLTARQVWEIENARANATLETLTRLVRPYGFQVGVILADPELPPTRQAAGEEADRGGRPRAERKPKTAAGQN